AAARLIAARASGAARFDAVLSTSPPDSVHLAALSLRRRFPLPWVADFRDPWMGLWFRRPPTGWHRARHEALEAQVLAGAALVIAASDTHARSLERRRGGSSSGPRAVAHLPNGFEPGVGARGADAEAAAKAAGDEAAARAGEPFTLVYTGTLSLVPDASVLL